MNFKGSSTRRLTNTSIATTLEKTNHGLPDIHAALTKETISLATSSAD